MEAAERVLELFGDTAGKVITRRGKHFLYRDAQGSGIGGIQSLKKFGLNADLKHGKTIVVAPPSTHEMDRSFTYQWDGCDENVIRDLPRFKTQDLVKLMERWSETLHNTTTLPPRPPSGLHRHEFRNDSRKLGLNDHLVSLAGRGKLLDLDTALAAGFDWNESLRSRGIEPMDSGEVVRVVSFVVQDWASGKLVPTRGNRGTCISDADEVRELGRAGQNGSDAFALLQLFRAEHSVRATFHIAIHAMVRDHVMGTWSARRYRAARDLLLTTHKIEEASKAKKSMPAKYRLVDRLLTPSMRQTEQYGASVFNPGIVAME